MSRNQERINKALTEMKTRAKQAANKAKRSIEKDLSKAPSHIREMNRAIEADVKAHGGTINEKADYSRLYSETQRKLGGLLIDGEKRYDPYLLDAHSQAVVFFHTLEDNYQPRIHERLDKVAHFLAPSLVSEDAKGRMTFQTVASGESLSIHYSERDLKQSISAVLHQNSKGLAGLLKAHPELASQLVAERLEHALQDRATRARIEAAIANKPRVWEGSPTQRKLGLKRGLTMDGFAEHLRSQTAADYLVFMFKSSDIGVPYALAHEYMSTFRRFAPLSITVKVGHFMDLYEQMPTIFNKEHREKGGKTIPVLRFDKSAKTTSEQLWDFAMGGNPNVQLQSPIPSGMFIEQAAMYGKEDVLKSYAQYERINGVRYFRNTAYNSVRRRLFRGYGG